MAAGKWTLPTAALTSLLNGTFDVDTDSYKVALFTSSSNIGAGSTTFAAVTNQVAQANGYTTGGIAVTLTLTGTTTVECRLASNPVWTASGGNITARFAVLYEVGGNVVAYCLLDSAPADVIATDGNTLTLDSDGSPSPVFTLTQAA
jgi:hypothetical protein